MKMRTLGTSEAIEFCDKIKLSEFNQIQPHGALFTLDKQLHVRQYSENVSGLLSTSGEEILNHPITRFLKPESDEDNVELWLSQATNHYKRMIWDAHGKKIPVLVYIYQNDETIIEVEPSNESHEEYIALFDLIQYVISSMKNTMHCHNIQELAQTTCEEIKKITGHNRVIIYQFDEQDQSGIVIGEAHDSNMESYLGLRFPANDIPQSVRAMYLKLPLRYIPTIMEHPVAITPELNPVTNEYLDLSNANLRMVAPVHIQYMTNMKIKSATSVAIIHDEKLWGLIACHHKEPKFLSLNMRLTLLLIANTLATQTLALESSLDYMDEERTVELQTNLTTHLNKSDSLSSALDQFHGEMMELASASGMSIYFQGILINYGETPTNEQISELISWLETKSISIHYSTPSLPLEFSPAMHYKNKACGLLAIKMTALENHYLLFYRPERFETITWAGNPEETLKCSRTTYSPRDSFERFLQTISNQSPPWHNNDIKSAGFIRSIVANKQLQDLLQVQAMHDPLTTLLNRLYLEQRLALEIQRCSRERIQMAIILTDIDFFKKINDTFGHPAGDTVLTEVAKLLKNHFRGYDYIYRYGGEEFLMLLPGVDLVTAKQKAEALGIKVKELVIKHAGTELPRISISSGISIYPDNGVDARSLIAAADVALYQAKKNGRDQVVGALVRA